MEKNPQVELLEERLKLAESELQEALERAEKAEEALNKPTAPPAPPPPPPPSFMISEPPVVPLRVKRRSRVNIAELAETIGIKESVQEPNKPTGVNDDIINVIKSGNFTLRKVKNNNKKERDGSKAVSELLNILGSLRKAPKSRKSQIYEKPVF